MDRDQITRRDFPPAGDGYDRASVDAHLAAVAAWTAALEAQITALEVERDTLRARGPATAEPISAEPQPSDPAIPEPRAAEPGRASAASVDPATPGDDEVSARLVATRLALEGSQHEEIVARLAGSYELEDAESLVEDVLSRLA